MSTIERRHSTNFKRALTNYFRLTAIDDDVTFTITIGSSVNTTILRYIEYSINEGKTWTRLTNANSTTKTATISNISVGSSVLLRGNGTNMSISAATGAANFTWFRANKKYKVSGVIMTLLKGKWADENTSIGTQLYTFKLLFTDETNLTDAGDLILPPDVINYCYYFMFYKCTNLTRAPLLRALTLKYKCYLSMFSGCSKLIYLKMLATDISASDCLHAWLSSPLSNLEFHRNSQATWWVTGTSGIPLQCTLFDDTEETAEEETFIDSEIHRVILANWGNRKPANKTYALGGLTRYEWKDSIRIGGIQGKILKRQLANILTILKEFNGNTSIVDFSDFALKFPNLLTIGPDSSGYYGSLSSCFYNCTSLKYITIPNKVRYLGPGYTYGNGCLQGTAIENIYIPDSVTTSCDHLFDNCKKLKTVRWSSNLPIKVNTGNFYNAIFYGCSNLETIENYPTTGSIIPASNWEGCSKLDISQFYPLLQLATTIGSRCIKGTNVTNLPQDLIFYNCTSSLNYTFSGVGRRKIFAPKLTTMTLYSLAENNASLIDLGNVTGSYFNPGAGNSSTNTVTVILRSTAVPTFSTFNKTNVRRIYVYDSIIDDFKANSKYSTAASITFPIGGEEWFADFESYYEYADYPMSDTMVFDESNNISIDFPIYNPDVTFSLYFNGSNYRSIVLPFADIGWEQARMGGDEMKEITGVTATVDGEGNLTGFTVLYATATTIVANKPYIITSGMNGVGVGNNDYSESLIALGVVLKTTPITDEFTSNGYKFSFTGTYELIDNMEGKYAFNGTDWILCTSADTIKPTYVYLEITKIEE